MILVCEIRNPPLALLLRLLDRSDAQALGVNLAADRSKTGTENPEKVLEAIKLTMKSWSERAVIFVAHSLKGLICPQARVIGDRGTLGDNPQLIAQETRGMMFLGTPFRGSKPASLKESVSRILGLGANIQIENLELPVE